MTRPETVTYLAACPCGYPNAVWAGAVDSPGGNGTVYEVDCPACRGDLSWDIRSQAARRVARGDAINKTRETLTTETPRRASILQRLHRTANRTVGRRPSHL